MIHLVHSSCKLMSITVKWGIGRDWVEQENWGVHLVAFRKVTGCAVWSSSICLPFFFGGYL